MEALVGYKESPEQLTKLQPLHEQGRRGEDIVNRSNLNGSDSSQVEFGPGQEEPTLPAVARKPPTTHAPTERNLLPSVRDSQRKAEAAKKESRKSRR